VASPNYDSNRRNVQADARLLADKDGKFSLGPIDPKADPKRIPAANDLITGTSLYFVVTMPDNQERKVDNVEVTPVRGRNNEIQALTVKITVH
jgi:hypothetical protein